MIPRPSDTLTRLYDWLRASPTGLILLALVVGIGGGFLMPPLLIFVGISPAVVVASVSPQIAASLFTGFLAYWRKRSIDFDRSPAGSEWIEVRSPTRFTHLATFAAQGRTLLSVTIATVSPRVPPSSNRNCAPHARLSSGPRGPIPLPVIPNPRRLPRQSGSLAMPTN